MSDKTIGDRLGELRRYLDVTQEGLAERSGVHVDTIRKLEQNIRQSARLSTLRALARALDTELDRLLGQPTVTTELPDDGGLIALRDAIQDISVLPGVPADGLDEEPPSAEVWMNQVRAATSLYWKGRYSRLAGSLPLVLRDGRAVARETTGSLVEQVWKQLALAYQLAASLTTQAGHPDWAFEAVAKQLDAAQRASDPLMEGMGVSTLSWVLLRQGRWEEAQLVAERKADALEPPMRGGTSAQYAVYGNLLVAAATPAARRDRKDDADQFLNFAEAAAVRSGPVRVYGTAFSPVDVKTQIVNVALAGNEPDPAKALEAAADVRHELIRRPVHLAAHRLDVAQARYQTGDDEGALETLLEVEADQPEWIRYQALARATVLEMREEEQRRNTRLRGLAARLGVEPAL
ncbi:helix-turn-helix domain-containing protein [Streptomyces botrytidirepellens]|uniref:XRE family transcriptional regulator n=1 Tax=Streptomyces botrytidirepellens TaxID=2486417 RepID=A0A3M8WPB0_9ACTN|nr:helix-turn-helix transcriptional regulator [Streptomyces botrytidirepellens]RNG30425.1 XRE family transcriptional regulator [Streptomyces botrytidirepellens]